MFRFASVRPARRAALFTTILVLAALAPPPGLLPPGPAAAEEKPGVPTPTRWSEAGALVDLGEPRPVSGVVFELGDGPWTRRPRVQSSRDGEAWDDVAATASLADATLALYRDPRHGRGALRFPPLETRFLRVGREVPARGGALERLP